MPKQRPQTGTTYQDHFQDWNVKPKQQNVRPKTAPVKFIETFEDFQCPVPFNFRHKKTPEVNLCQHRNISAEGKCVHVNVYSHYQINCKNIPTDDLKDFIDYIYTSERKEAEKLAVKPKLKRKESNPRFKIKRNVKVIKRDNKKAKLFEPPWGYKGKANHEISENFCPQTQFNDCHSIPGNTSQSNPFLIVMD